MPYTNMERMAISAEREIERADNVRAAAKVGLGHTIAPLAAQLT